MPTPTRGDGLRELLKLSEDYLSSDQFRNVIRYEEFLASEFTASLPDHSIYDRRAFLEMIVKPRPSTDLKYHNVQIT